MTLKFYSIWGWMPVLSVSVSRLPGRLVGACLGPMIVLDRSHDDDWPTIVHELEHCKQFWKRGAIVHFALYYLSHRYRLSSELDAYCAELRACSPAERGPRLDDSARALAVGYGLSIDAAACRRLLLASLTSDQPLAGLPAAKPLA